MEDYLSKISSEGETLYSSQKSRIKPPSRTGIFEDLGSSFKTQRPHPKGKKAASPRKRRSPPLSDFGSEDDSIDELDCFSQQSTRVDASRKGQSKSQTQQLHSYHPDVLTGRSNALKKLKFNKKSNSTEGGKNKISPLRPKPQPKAKEPRYRSDRETASEDEVHKPARIGKDNSIASSTNTISSRPKPRPRPRPVPRPPPPSGDSPESLFGTSKAPSRTASLSTIPLPSPLSQQKTSAPRFNETSPIANTSSSSTDSKSATSSSHPPPPSDPSYRSTRVSLSSSAPRPLQSFPGVSPLNSPARKRSEVAGGEGFPVLSPLNRSTKNVTLAKAVKKGKGKRKASDRILQPFPMSTQDFGDMPPSSDDDSDANGHHARKRKYQEHMEEFSDMELYEEDSLFMSPAVDPKTLCPYCDEPLPTTPTPHLHRLLQTIYKRSHPDPRSTNPLGRKAPLSTFASVCRRHRFESEILPEAEAKGWPKNIDWECLGTRIENLRERLREIIDDPGPKNVNIQMLEGGKEGGESGMFMLTNFIGKGPRLHCVFWREAMKAVLLRGTRALNGVRAQFLDFDRSLPGYYGEIGSMIIHQTLLNMFPLDTFDPQTIAPFTANDFIQRILIPEVGLQLIMEDRGLKGLIGAETAFQVLRDSTAYGAAMFPEDSGEDAAAKKMNDHENNDDNDCFDVGIGDRIVMERARKRRKEIEDEIEGRKESVMHNKEEEKKRKPRGWEPTPNETASEVDERTSRTPPRRKSSSRQKKNGIGTDSDVMSITDGGSGTDLEMKTDGSLPCSRPQRNTRRVNYMDYSSDDDGIQLEKRGRRKKSEPRPSSSSNSKSRYSTSLATNERPILRKAAETKVDLRSKDLSFPTDGICSGEEERNLINNPRILAESPVKKKLGRKANSEKDNKQERITDMDMDTMDTDVDTPMPKRRAVGSVARDDDVDLTPRPGVKPDPASWSSGLGLGAHDSVLARARARIQGASGHDHQTKKNTASTSEVKSSKKAEWISHMREDPVSDDGSDRCLSLNSGSSESEGDETSRRKGKGRGKSKNKEKETEEYRWLLSDPSSQEGKAPVKRNTGRPAR